MPVIEKTSHGLRIIKFHSHKDFVKNIPASIAKGSKENQRTFRSSWSNVVAILQQSERGDLETKFKFFIACALYVPPLVIMGSESNMADGATEACDWRFQYFLWLSLF